MSKKERSGMDVKTKPPSPKKKKSEKRSSEDWSQKYANILPDSVKCVAEMVGIPGLSDEAANALSEDVSYRLRSILQLCSKYMKHTRRKRLCCGDVNEVMKMCDIPIVIGHSTLDGPRQFIAIPDSESNREIFVLDDPEVDLYSYFASAVNIIPRTADVVTGKWLPAEDQRPKLKVEDARGIDATDGRQPNNVANLYIKADGDVRTGDCQRPHDVSENEPIIPPNLIKYYGITCSTLLGHGDLKIVYRDLSRNDKIVPIIPLLLNFIHATLNRLASERHIMRLLQTVEALTQNTRIDFRPYQPVAKVASAFLRIIRTSYVERKTTSFTYSNEIRIRTAQVLAKVMQKWHCSAEQRQSVLKEMGTLLADFRLTPKVHVGAVLLLEELGSDALCQNFWPVINEFLRYVASLREEESKKYHGMQKKDKKFLDKLLELQKDRQYLQFATLAAAVVLYRNPHNESTQCPSVEKIDQALYEFFADGICPIQLHLLENPVFIRKHFCPQDLPLHYKPPDNILKGTWKLPRCLNSLYNPDSKRATVEKVFELRRARKRYPRITFKFVGSKPISEINLKRRRLDSRYSQFVTGSVSEGHVILAGKFWRRPNINRTCFPIINSSLFLTI